MRPYAEGFIDLGPRSTRLVFDIGATADHQLFPRPDKELLKENVLIRAIP